MSLVFAARQMGCSFPLKSCLNLAGGLELRAELGQSWASETKGHEEMLIIIPPCGLVSQELWEVLHGAGCAFRALGTHDGGASGPGLQRMPKHEA